MILASHFAHEFDYEQRHCAEVLIALHDNNNGGDDEDDDGGSDGSDEYLYCNFDYHIAAAIILSAFVRRLIVQGVLRNRWRINL